MVREFSPSLSHLPKNWGLASSADSDKAHSHPQGRHTTEADDSSHSAYLEPDAVARLEKCATNVRDRLLIRLLFHLGCRVSEALGIVVGDIDLVNGLVTIEHLKVRLQASCPSCHAQLARNHTYCPKCGAKVQDVVAQEKQHRRVRTLPIDTVTLAMLRDYISRGGPVTKNGNRLIFGINRHRAWQIVRDCAQRAGLPKLVNPETGKTRNVSPHRLRDSFAVHAVKTNDSGDGLRMLQEHLGHQSFNTTARYRKVSGQEQREWYDRLWESHDTTNAATGTKQPRR